MNLRSILKKWEYKKYRLLWAAIPFLSKIGYLTKFPLHLDLELSARCNLQCIHCPHSETYKNFAIGDMPFEMAANILKQGAIGEDGRAYSVKLQWRGESTLYSQLNNVIEIAHDLDYIDIMLNTNGNCKWGILESAIENGLTYLAFSIDGANKNDYLKIRKGGNFELVMENLQGACKMMKSYPRLRVVLQATVMDSANPKELEKFVRILPDGCALKFRSATWRMNLIKKPEGLKRQNCWQPWRRLLIDWQGNVCPCCASWDGHGKLGNVKDNSLQNIWRENIISEYRERLKDKSAWSFDPCKSCFSRESYK